MSNKFYKIIVSDLIRETADSLTISFDVPKELGSEFKYKAGQYLTINVPISNGFERRAYSISSSPEFNEPLSVTIKKIESGAVSTYLHSNIKIGDVLDVMSPQGNFTREDGKYEQSIVLYAGGSGITPLFSILKSSIAKSKSSKILLFFSNKNQNSIIFYNQLKELEKKYSSQLQIIHTLTQNDEKWNGHKGRLCSDFIINKLNEVFRDSIAECLHFVCGPQGLIKEVEQALLSLNIPSNFIKKELFTVTIKQPQVLAEKQPSKLTKRSVKVKLYGEVHQIDVEPDETIVTALQKNGAEPPFSCQIGACSTCRAKVISGSVLMDEREALTDEEIQDGLILSCQAHPTSDNCFIDYDSI